MDLLATIIASSDDAIYTKSPDAVITSWNPAAERLYGYAADEAIGHPVAMLIPRERSGEDIVILARVLAGQRVDHFETDRLRKDARVVRVSLTVSPLHAPDGTVLGASVIARDITDRDRGDEARALLAAIVDDSDDAIYSKSPLGLLTSWNRAAEHLYGYSAAEAIGRPVAVLIPPHRKGEDTMVLGRILAGERIDHFETERVRKDGSIVPVSVTASPIRSSSGTILGASIVARDISGRLRTDLERARYLTALEDYNTIIAHDLTEPARTIAGFAEWLELRHGDALDERARGAVRQIRSSAERMQALIQGLREYARAGEVELHEQDVDLREVVDATLSGLSRRLEESGADVRVGELPTVRGDPLLLGQLVQNLLSNAVKFRGDDPPAIEVDALRDGASRVLRVSDNGIGIPADAGPSIFGMYGRLHPRERYPGTGVGLAVVSRIAQRHGGRIWFEPRDGGGTRFCVSLPACD